MIAGRRPARATRRCAPRSRSRRRTGCCHRPGACAAACRVEEIHAACRIRPVVPARDRRRIVAAEADGARATACRRRRKACCALKAHGLLRRAPRRAGRPQRGRGRGRARARSACARSSSASTPAPPSSPRPRPTCIRPTRATALEPRRMRGRADRPRKVIILGGGPNRIGQGIEFDYCCVHAAFALSEAGYRDDHGQLQPGDRLDRLRHLRPALFRAADRRGRDRAGRVEQRKGTLLGVIVQFGGQTPLKLAARAGGRRHPDPRHLARRHRPGRGPRALPAAARASSTCASRRNGIARSVEEAERGRATRSAIRW